MFTTAGAADLTSGANDSIVSARDAGTIFVWANETGAAAISAVHAHISADTIDFRKTLRMFSFYHLSPATSQSKKGDPKNRPFCRTIFPGSLRNGFLFHVFVDKDRT